MDAATMKTVKDIAGLGSRALGQQGETLEAWGKNIRTRADLACQVRKKQDEARVLAAEVKVAACNNGKNDRERAALEVTMLAECEEYQRMQQEIGDLEKRITALDLSIAIGERTINYARDTVHLNEAILRALGG